ncbi:hypothetical protein LPTSP4_08080 [Leptospira ryugenii]|uniref:Uncharacterized protein n=1 Tax=Leptospira ryugenii TaxID=1917863 RepID=A0A2P2DXD7_9LEPT|nr:hypothetical protein [Leptospira ryugenii]GBF49298.1 hypothetical protein LPTSP4_08080 [Leptospira ryugenii]
MAKGYHSRSPEEFREYLKSLEKSKSKWKWRQIVLLLDVILLIFVVYLVFRELNPGSFQDPNLSTKQVIDGYQSYFALSREADEHFQGYFFFLENKSEIPLQIPLPDWKSEFRILTKEGIECYHQKVDWKLTEVPARSKGFLYVSIPLSALKTSNTVCTKEIFDEEYSFFRSKFKALTLYFQAELSIQSKTQRYVFLLKQKPFRVSK